LSAEAWQKLYQQLTEQIEKVIQLRFSVYVPNFDAPITDVHSAFVNLSPTLSEIEKQLALAMRIKALADRKVAAFKMQYQEEWDKVIVKPVKKFAVNEYSTGKERAAEANLATLETARQLRREEELQAFADEAVNVIRLHYYGLDKVRQDLRKRLDFSQQEYFSA
jgi:hypothetical protein